MVHRLLRAVALYSYRPYSTAPAVYSKRSIQRSTLCSYELGITVVLYI